MRVSVGVTTWSRGRESWTAGERRPSRRRSGPPHAARCRRERRPGSPACDSGAPAAWPRRWTSAGARVDEALEALARYLDDASLAGLEQVTIIHGLGTGALRDAVRVQAASHPLVKSFRAGERGEGGDGATIVRL